jgi:hypothetical protein
VSLPSGVVVEAESAAPPTTRTQPCTTCCHAGTNSDLIDKVINYQADRSNFAQQPEHLRRPSNDEAPPPAKRSRSSRNRAPKQ